MSKFYGRRTHAKGQMIVQTGFRDGDLTLRIFLPSVAAASLTYQQASDLADALDAALDQQDEDPLL